ncbi:MAG TPA: gamma carbonic anhydrase family protein [Mycobacteriales bacterium]|nr:gamma carbonic anhydrase family protein [Mycobacteriales bacterium]
MPLFSFEGLTPQIHRDAFIAPTASIVGDVTIEEGASVWYGAVLRADFGPIVVKAGANIQDGAIVHGAGLVEIGAGATVAHQCVVHGAIIGTEALIGNGAVIQDGARIGDRALVAAGALVPPNAVVEPGTLFRGAAGSSAGPLSAGAAHWVETNPEEYRKLARRHIAGAALIES